MTKPTIRDGFGIYHYGLGSDPNAHGYPVCFRLTNLRGAESRLFATPTPEVPTCLWCIARFNP